MSPAKVKNLCLGLIARTRHLLDGSWMMFPDGKALSVTDDQLSVLSSTTTAVP
jgi:hypothetical protein